MFTCDLPPLKQNSTFATGSHPSPFGTSGEDPSACNNYQSVNKTYAFIMSECGPDRQH